MSYILGMKKCMFKSKSKGLYHVVTLHSESLPLTRERYQEFNAVNKLWPSEKSITSLLLTIINMGNFWEMYNTSTILTLLNGEMREMEKNLNMWQLSAECCEEYIKQKKRFLQLFQSSWQGFLKKLKRLPSKVFF